MSFFTLFSLLFLGVFLLFLLAGLNRSGLGSCGVGGCGNRKRVVEIIFRLLLFWQGSRGRRGAVLICRCDWNCYFVCSSSCTLLVFSHSRSNSERRPHFLQVQVLCTSQCQNCRNKAVQLF